MQVRIPLCHPSAVSEYQSARTQTSVVFTGDTGTQYQHSYLDTTPESFNRVAGTQTPVVLAEDSGVEHRYLNQHPVAIVGNLASHAETAVDISTTLPARRPVR